MKKTLLLFTILLSAAITSQAQYSGSAVPKIDFGFVGGVTVGAASGYFPEAGGLEIKLEYPLTNSPVNFIVKTGFTFYSSGSTSIDVGGYGADFSYGTYGDGSSSVAAFIPVEVGAKAYVIDRFFIEGDVGVSFNINSYSEDYTSKKTALIFSPSVGYSFPLGEYSNHSMDLGVGYESRVDQSYGSYNQVYIKAAYRFGL